MKLFFCSLFLGATLICQSQKIFFPAKNFSYSTKYEEAIRKLATILIPIYKNNDRGAYYNDLFRLNFAKQDYSGTIRALDSFSIIAVPDKKFYSVPGFHYRIHSLATLALQNNKSGTYEKEYQSAFVKTYYPIPDEGKDQVKGIYERANTAGEREDFLAQINKYKKSGADSLTIIEAVALVKQWNFWFVYSKTLAIARNQVAIADAFELANRENKLLGLDEGVTLNPSAKTYITNVTYLDVEKKTLVTDATVGITGNTITSVNTKNKLPIPADATIIDGTGKFLSPGFADAHIHFFQSGGLYARPEGFYFKREIPYEKEIEWTHLNMKDFLKRYIQTGITSVIDVGATYNFLELRDKYRDKSFAPSVFMTGPLITTSEPEVYKNRAKDEPFSLVATPEEGIRMVQQQLPYRPDFIKIWYILESGVDKEISARKFLPIIKAVIGESHKHNLKVAVHATERITAQLAVENGADYLVHSVDDEVISNDFLALLKNKNTILCPTLVVGEGYYKTAAQEHNFSLAELRKSNPLQLGTLYDVKHLPGQNQINAVKTSTRNYKTVYVKQDSISFINLKKMADAGIRIAAGTDAGNTGTLHATSFINELNKMKKSGMSNWQILQSATLNPAFILGKEKEIGSIAVGKKADLVLLNANPVDDLNNLEQVSLVINKGHIIKPDTLVAETPLALVQRQLNAYNARNLEAFLEPYADDVELYEFPDRLTTKGKEAMRKDYAFFNTVTDLHCEIKERIIQGNTIIDKESVFGFGPRPVEATAIYVIEKSKIKKVYFIQ